jgi:hypothetical protein
MIRKEYDYWTAEFSIPLTKKQKDKIIFRGYDEWDLFDIYPRAHRNYLSKLKRMWHNLYWKIKDIRYLLKEEADINYRDRD